MRILKLADINLLELGHTTQLTGMILTDSKEEWEKLIRQTDTQMAEIIVDDKGCLKKQL